MKYKLDKEGKLITVLSETDITKEIRKELKRLGVWHFKLRQGLGSVKGLPDLVCCYRGQFIGIEVKTPRGRISEHQQLMGDRISAAGGIWFVARTAGEVADRIKIISEQGREVRESPPNRVT